MYVTLKLSQLCLTKKNTHDYRKMIKSLSNIQYNEGADNDNILQWSQCKKIQNRIYSSQGLSDAGLTRKKIVSPQPKFFKKKEKKCQN